MRTDDPPARSTDNHGAFSVLKVETMSCLFSRSACLSVCTLWCIVKSMAMNAFFVVFHCFIMSLPCTNDVQPRRFRTKKQATQGKKQFARARVFFGTTLGFRTVDVLHAICMQTMYAIYSAPLVSNSAEGVQHVFQSTLWCSVVPHSREMVPPVRIPNY